MNNKKIMNKNSRGFTLIELLVVIAIIGLLATMSVIALGSARESARDSRRLSDIRQMQTALEMYYSNVGEYPSEVAAGGSIGGEDGIPTFMAEVPANPTPTNDGDCASDLEYDYTQEDDGASYTIEYCIGGDSGDIPGGLHCATPAGLTAGTVYAGDPEEPDGCEGEST